MMDRKIIQDLASNYDFNNTKVGMIASHSALDVCDGAVEEGLPTLAICQKGREKTYADYFKTIRDAQGNRLRGFVDQVIVYDKYREVMDESQQQMLVDNNVLFVPNRSFTSYVPIGEIEENFKVPMVGNRNLLRTEERGEPKDYYWICEQAGLPAPEPVKPESINELTIVKLHHAVKKLERGFFTCSSYEEYKEKAHALLAQGVIDQESLDNARVERYIIGPVFNFDFFYSPIETMGEKVELIGVDWRFESSLDGHVRLPADQQMSLNEKQMTPEYTVVGHNSATLRESLLEKVFPLAERYIEFTNEAFYPGTIGPFCLQTCVDKDMNFYIYDVAPRVGGGTNVHMSVGHPYGNALWRAPMSTGRRLALEIKRAIKINKIEEIVT